MAQDISAKTRSIVDQTLTYCANNYIPADVVFSEAKGVWITDVDGKRYLDMLAAYSALNFGHCNPRIEKAAIEQLQRLTLTSRAFYNDQLGPFSKELAELCGMEAVLPMNSGAEAVESAIKLSRKWGYEQKQIERDRAEIIVFKNNFHGRTTTIISFSESVLGTTNFGPFTPGFVSVPFGNIEALQAVVNKNTAAILMEPIQGEGGVIIPPDGFLRDVRKLCTSEKVLMIADEIQTGMCRTGKFMACDHEQVKPDLYILGKSLGGGILPCSAIIGGKDLIGLSSPGTHGSTLGGNPFACRIAREVMAIIREDRPEKAVMERGIYLEKKLIEMSLKKITAIRCRGLMCGIDIHPQYGKAKDFCKQLLAEGVVTYHTREQTIRIAPPLTITKDELDWGLERLGRVLA